MNEIRYDIRPTKHVRKVSDLQRTLGCGFCAGEITASIFLFGKHGADCSCGATVKSTHTFRARPPHATPSARALS